MKRVTFMTGILVTLATLCAYGPNPAAASQIVQFHAGFSPDRLGAGTTIHFGFTIASTTDEVPSPVTNVNLQLPKGMGSVTNLGVAACDTKTLLTHGLNECPGNAHIGYGSAVVEVPFGPVTVREKTGVAALMGPPEANNSVVLFYANGQNPLFAQLVFPAQVISGGGAVRGGINTAIPLVPTVPEAPDAAIVQFESTIGPERLTYHKRQNGRIVSYRPMGVPVPRVCPSSGFLFSAVFSFQDGSSIKSTTHVPCPRSR
jgi:hypothetical protein